MLVLKYKKEGRAKFISHLDMLKHMGKILRRANVKVEFSKGFNPHEILYFSPANVCGSTSDCEYMVVATNHDKDDFLKKFNSVAIEGITGLYAVNVAKNPNLAAICNQAEYEIKASEKEAENVKKAFEKEVFEVTFTQKGEEKTQDVRGKMISYEYEGGVLKLVLAAGNTTLRTDRFLPAVGIETPANRTKLFAKMNGGTVDVDDMLEVIQI
ncbi:MAG: TIGR03936 family radical SAM-associated protein [Bacillota bacterium]